MPAAIMYKFQVSQIKDEDSRPFTRLNMGFNVDKRDVTLRENYLSGTNI